MYHESMAVTLTNSTACHQGTPITLVHPQLIRAGKQITGAFIAMAIKTAELEKTTAIQRTFNFPVRGPELTCIVVIGAGCWGRG